MKILSIVDTAYRATLEEQDETILWLNHALRNNAAELSILLTGNAGNYAVQGQDAAGLAFGDKRLAHLPRLVQDLDWLMAAKVAVFAVEADIRERALPADRLVAGIEKLSRAAIPEAIERFDHVWRW